MHHETTGQELERTTAFASPSYQEALEHIRASARILGNLGSIGAASVGGIVEQIEHDRSTNEARAKAEQEKQEREGELAGAVHSMVSRLPQAEAIVGSKQRKWWDARDNRGIKLIEGRFTPDDRTLVFDEDGESSVKSLSYAFRVPSIEQARRAETQVLWVSGWDAAEYHTASGMDRQSRREATARYTNDDVDRYIPFYVIGERVGKPNRDASDAGLDLLLVRAVSNVKEHGFATAWVSSRLRDLSDEQAIKSLDDPVTRRDFERVYDGNNPDGFRVPLRRVLGARWRGSGKLVGAVEAPRRDKKHAAFWADLETKIARNGLPASIVTGRSLTLEMFQEYNVGFHAHKLAILMGNEDAFTETLGQVLYENQKPKDQ